VKKLELWHERQLTVQLGRVQHDQKKIHGFVLKKIADHLLVVAEAAQARYYCRVIESMLTRSWWTTTIFYEAFDEPPAPNHFGVCVDDPDAGPGYDEKPVMGLLRDAAQAPALCPEPPDAGADADGDAGDAEGVPPGGCGCESGGEPSFYVALFLAALVASRLRERRVG